MSTKAGQLHPGFAALKAIGEASIPYRGVERSEMDSVEEEPYATESPSRSRGTGAGASIFGTAAITLCCAPFRTAGLGLAAAAKRTFGVLKFRHRKSCGVSSSELAECFGHACLEGLRSRERDLLGQRTKFLGLLGQSL